MASEPSRPAPVLRAHAYLSSTSAIPLNCTFRFVGSATEIAAEADFDNPGAPYVTLKSDNRYQTPKGEGPRQWRIDSTDVLLVENIHPDRPVYFRIASPTQAMNFNRVPGDCVFSFEFQFGQYTVHVFGVIFRMKHRASPEGDPSREWKFKVQGIPIRRWFSWNNDFTTLRLHMKRFERYWPLCTVKRDSETHLWPKLSIVQNDLDALNNLNEATELHFWCGNATATTTIQKLLSIEDGRIGASIENNDFPLTVVSPLVRRAFWTISSSSGDGVFEYGVKFRGRVFRFGQAADGDTLAGEIATLVAHIHDASLERFDPLECTSLADLEPLQHEVANLTVRMDEKFSTADGRGEVPFTIVGLSQAADVKIDAFELEGLLAGCVDLPLYFVGTGEWDDLAKGVAETAPNFDLVTDLATFWWDKLPACVDRWASAFALAPPGASINIWRLRKLFRMNREREPGFKNIGAVMRLLELESIARVDGTLIDISTKQKVSLAFESEFQQSKLLYAPGYSPRQSTVKRDLELPSKIKERIKSWITLAISQQT
jgi:hypothetical protein